jgi:hypothetical protein
VCTHSWLLLSGWCGCIGVGMFLGAQSPGIRGIPGSRFRLVSRGLDVEGWAARIGPSGHGLGSFRHDRHSRSRDVAALSLIGPVGAYTVWWISALRILGPQSGLLRDCCGLSSTRSVGIRAILNSSRYFGGFWVGCIGPRLQRCPFRGSGCFGRNVLGLGCFGILDLTAEFAPTNTSRVHAELATGPAFVFGAASPPSLASGVVRSSAGALALLTWSAAFVGSALGPAGVGGWYGAGATLPVPVAEVRFTRGCGPGLGACNGWDGRQHECRVAACADAKRRKLSGMADMGRDGGDTVSAMTSIPAGCYSYSGVGRACRG